MRKKIKKIMTVAVSTITVSGLLFGNTIYAMHSFCSAKTAAGAVKTAAQNVSEHAAQKKAASGVEKEETVYVTMDASGEKQEVIVSDWLKNSGISGTLTDVSELEDIQNTKGEETFTQDGSTLSWEAGEEDIYYQGISREELPVGMEITYVLDGEEIVPDKLAGKSGKLEIFIQYTNSSVASEEQGKEIYTPFVMVTGMILPVETFSNVTVDNGEIFSEGDNDVLVAYGMPGLKESMDIDSIDFGDVSVDTGKISSKITDSVTITADVTDFSMGKTYTVATADLLETLNFDDISDGDELNGKLEELKEAALELAEGSGQIQDGLRDLEDNFSVYEEAVQEVEESMKKIKNGNQKLSLAAGEYTKSTDKLLEAVNIYGKGAKKFAGSTKSYCSATGNLVDGIGALYSATSTFPKSYQEFDASLQAYTKGVNSLLSENNMTNLTDAASSLQAGVKQVDEGIKKVQSAVEEINDGAAAFNEQKENAEQCIAGLQTIESQYAALADAAGDAETKAQYEELAEAAAGAVSYMQAAEELAEDITVATNGKSDGSADNDGKADLAAALEQIEAATDTNSGTENLYTGLSSLNQSVETMADNAETLRNSKTALLSASSRIDSSISEINENMQTLYRSGKQITANNKKLEKAADSLSVNAKKIKKNSKKLTSAGGTFRQSARTLASGSGKLYNGIRTLAGKTGDVTGGIEQLTDGAVELYDGMQKFRRDGIDKMTDTVTAFLNGGQDLQETVEKLTNASKDYQSFSGISDDMDGSVKFVFTTEEIKSATE